VLKEIEGKRAAGLLGSSLQAEVGATLNVQSKALLNSLKDDLRFVFITSAAWVSEETVDGLNSIAVIPSSHPKCARCWHYRADVGSNPEHATICGRCVSNLFGEGEKRFYA
jgi:isoleucyl-tRNA synthetase